MFWNSLQLSSYLLYSTSRKEFSNDPTTELNELSHMFQLQLVSMKRDMEVLKNKSTLIKVGTLSALLFYFYIL